MSPIRKTATTALACLGLLLAAGPPLANTGYSNLFTVDLRGCTLACTATANPTSGNAPLTVNFSASATPSNCSGTVSYAWAFGDGTTSSTKNTAHTYTSAGTYTWTLTASISGVTCLRTGTITVTGGGTVPSCASNPTPSNNATDAITTQALTWDTVAGATSYDIFFGTSSSPPLVANQTTATYSPGTLQTGTTYFWKIVPKNATGSATGCPVWSFTVQPALSGKIQIKDPVTNDAWPLNGTGITSLSVQAKHHILGNTVTGYVDQSNSVTSYRFVTLDAGPYDVTLSVEYKDEVTLSNLFCFSTTLHKTTTLATYITVPGSGAIADLDLPLPIVFLHGILACYTKWYDASSSQYWDPTLRAEKGFLCFTPNYDYTGLSSWEESASQAFDQMQSGVMSVTTKRPHPPFFIIAHSMGGLVTRAITSGSHQYYGTTQSIRRIYLAGTPNSGSNFFIVNGVNQFLSEDVIQTDFNGAFRSFGEKPVSTFSGTHGSLANPYSDIYVPVDSVHHVYLKECSGPWYNRTCTAMGDLLPLPGDSVYNTHTELGSAETRQTLLLDEILPSMQAGGTLRKSVAFPEAAASGPSMRAIVSNTGSLSAGQAEDVPFSVSSTDMIDARGAAFEGAASFALVDPSGHVIDFGSLSPQAGEQGTDEFGERFALANPVAGEWKLRVQAGAGGAKYSAMAQERSLIGFEGYSAQPTVPLGQSAPLIGQWAGDAAGVSSPLVSAKVTNEAGASVGTANLFDDGAHQDGEAGDGIFGGETPVLSQPGRYRFEFSATGTYQGAPFSRWAQASVDVLAPSHILTGTFGDGGDDTDGDGIYDTVRFHAGLTAPGQGSFLLAADLLDAQGYPVSHAVGSLDTGGAGAFTVDVNFAMEGVPCGSYGSPFQVANIILRDGATLQIRDSWADPVQTQSYEGTLFGCNAGNPGPAVTSVAPAVLFPGDSARLLVSGTGFQAGATLSLGDGVAVDSLDFGDAALLFAQVTVSSGAAAGPRAVTITNPDARSSTAEGLFSVGADQPPSVAVSYPADGATVGGLVTVSASASDDRGIQKVEFYLDGALVATVEQFPYQSPWDTRLAANGPHKLLARATDGASFVTEASIQVTTANACEVACTASGTPATGTAPLAVTFTASTTPSHCSGEASYSWDFGDGQISTEQNPSHTYAVAGTYNWTLTVSQDGASCTQSGTVTVSAGVPGDCDGDGEVSIGEVQKAINMFLGTLAPGCGVDCSGDGTVSIGEVQKVVNAFLGVTASC